MKMIYIKRYILLGVVIIVVGFVTVSFTLARQASLEIIQQNNGDYLVWRPELSVKGIYSKTISPCWVIYYQSRNDMPMAPAALQLSLLGEYQDSTSEEIKNRMSAGR